MEADTAVVGESPIEPPVEACASADGEGLTDKQKLLSCGLADGREEQPTTVEQRAFFRILTEQDARTCVGIGRMLVERGHSEAVARGLLAAVPDEGRQDKCWDVADGILTVVSSEHAGALSDALTPHLCEMLENHVQKINPHRQYHMLGRWWNLFPPATMVAATALYKHNKPMPFTPAEFELATRNHSRSAEKRKRSEADDESVQGERWWDRGDFRKALRHYDRHLRLSSECEAEVSSAVLVRIAEAHYELREYEKALKVAELLVEAHNSWEGRELQGLIYRALGDPSSAALHIHEALSMCPDAHNKQRMGGVLEELKLEVLAGDNPAVGIVAMQDRATSAMVAGDSHTAVFCYTQLLSLDAPNTWLYLCNRSSAYAKLKRYSEALADAERVTELRPEWFKGWLRQGRALQGLKEHDRARVVLERGKDLQPWNSSINKLLTRRKKERS